MNRLTKLSTLCIEYCTGLHSLEGIGGLISLENLEVNHVPMLVGLPEELGCLKSLRQLLIWWCPNVSSLPDGMQHLTELQNLQIMQCPQLEERCSINTGEDWAKISHVPDIHIWLCY
nr:TPA_asm: hypothetical protein HUJ06_031687 [Nelumbo nucifera]